MTAQFLSDLHSQECATCGITFYVTKEFDQRRRDDKNWFYCPNGHNQRYTESEADRLRRERDRLRQRDAYNQDKIRELEYSNRGLKGSITKMKKRTAHGVCPCCKRTFQNLAAHMSTKHPDYTKTDVA